MPNTSTIDQTIIELSGKKFGLIIIGSCAFVAIGIWLFSLDPASIRALPRGSNPTFVHSIGLASVVFFGLCAIVAIPKLFDEKPGLVFASSGIIDNASSVSAGLIPWTEIIGAESFDVRKQKFLIIKVKDPQKYLDRGNRLKKLAITANYKMCGSPITISAIALKTSFPELLSLFDRYQQKYGNAKSSD
jgi:hypothetical protein